MQSFSEYVRANFVNLDMVNKASFRDFLSLWAKETVEDWNSKAPPHLKTLYQTISDQFKARLMTHVSNQVNPLFALGNVPTGQAMQQVVQGVDGVYNTNLLGSAQLKPGPVFAPDDNEFHPHSGIAFLGYIVGSDGKLSTASSWWKKPMYNAKHPLGDESDYVKWQGGNASLGDKAPGPYSLAPAQKAGKAAGTAVKLLGGDRHAEDPWFAFYYSDFKNDVLGLTGLDQLPSLPTGNTRLDFLKQTWTSPRLEFIDTCVPCQQDTNDANSGCRAYFKVIREDVGTKIPILLFTFKPYETGNANYAVQAFNSSGDMITYTGVSWR